MLENKNKIALLSCHNDPNYGSMLQAYALAAAIRKCGKEAEYLSFSPELEPHSVAALIKRLVKSILKALGIYHYDTSVIEFAFLKTPAFKKIMDSYDEFHEYYIPYSKKIFYTNNIKTSTAYYTNFIIGSDQLWSPFLYNRRKPFFLDFTEIRHKQSYATSLGTVEFTGEYLALLKKKLSTFEHISCREERNAKMLSRLLNKEVIKALDPTLLLDRADWDSIAKNPKMDKPYILAYILGEKKTTSNFAEQLGQKLNLPVFYILTRPCYLDKNNLIDDAGPAEFVGLIKNASYVVTDSFHGCLFSLNYNRNFYAFSKREGNLSALDNVRILDFLEHLALEKRFQSDEDAKILPDINYDGPNRKLEEMRRSSIEYLKEIINI